MKRLIGLSALVVGLTLAAPAVMAQGIAVSPSRIFFEGNKGETVVRALTFSNTSGTPFTLRASIKDWHRDSLGRKVYFQPGTQEHSNSDWITLSTSTVTLQPGATQEVMLAMTVPEEAPQRLTNSMVFFTQTKARQPAVSETPQLGVNVLLELGVQVYHNPGALATGELDFVAFDDFGVITTANGSVRRLGVKIKNSGELNQDAHLRFELTHIATGEELPVTTVPIAMLPGAEQWVYVDADASLDGHYLAVAILDAGGSYDLKVAEKELTY